MTAALLFSDDTPPPPAPVLRLVEDGPTNTCAWMAEVTAPQAGAMSSPRYASAPDDDETPQPEDEAHDLDRYERGLGW